MRAEDESINECKKELDSLLAEKQHHVEQLRQIHSDIYMVRKLPICDITSPVLQAYLSTFKFKKRNLFRLTGAFIMSQNVSHFFSLSSLPDHSLYHTVHLLARQFIYLPIVTH